MHHLYLFTILTFHHLLSAAATTPRYLHRRILHQPFFPLEQTPAITQPPYSAPSPQPQQPKYPFSSPSPPDATTQSQFFPNVPTTPPPPTSNTAFATFPANISSLVLPSSSHSSHSPTKFVSLIVLVSLSSVLLFASLLLLLLRHRRRHQHPDHHSFKSDSLRLFPPDTAPSDSADTAKKPPPPPFPHHTPTSTSSEFLYLGTLVSSRDPEIAPQNDEKPPAAAAPNFQTLGSPELHPLPPLPRHHSGQIYQNTPHQEEEDEEEEFFSPRASTANNASPYFTKSSPIPHNTTTGFLNPFDCNSSIYSLSPENSPSAALNSDSPRSIQTKSPDSSVVFPAPLPRFIPPPPPPAPQPRAAFSPFSPSSTEEGGTRDCSPRASDFSSFGITTPPPPPTGPPELVGPSRKLPPPNVNTESKSEETMRPKLKPLHWDKVRASSDRAMVWDQLKSSSFQLNEEMIETLFVANSSNANGKDGLRRHMIPKTSQENLVLDPKKSQNIAILLRALNVTIEEVCEALAEGNADTLGTELLESLLRMAPTKEEERKLTEFKDGQSPLKLGPAEAFLKAVLTVPFAFRRIDAMLYVANFESEIEHLNRSFDTLESACKELKNSRMFQKLLEAVLKTGNRMNTGTHRGDAHAFKLDTLLKLADVKGADGKTTLLHFVVQEIIKAEGARAHSSGPKETQQSTLRDEVEFKKLGLEVVSGLSGELTNVKKAAVMDSEVLANDVSKLAIGIGKIKEVLTLGDTKFSENMSEFLKKAEGEIGSVQAREGVVFSMVKGLTEYFHGELGKEEIRSLRLFMVVRDFISVLDRVCKDVGKINERAMVNSGREVRSVGNVGIVAPVFPVFVEGRQSSSSDDESSSSF